MKRVLVAALVFTLMPNLLIAWVLASAVTSGVKVAKDDCGKTYGIESVVSGDWFCPKEKE